LGYSTPQANDALEGEGVAQRSPLPLLLPVPPVLPMSSVVVVLLPGCMVVGIVSETTFNAIPMTQSTTPMKCRVVYRTPKKQCDNKAQNGKANESNNMALVKEVSWYALTIK
jgi:hypothetical protein